MKRISFVIAAVIGLAAPVSFAQTPPERNEQLARRLLFCMNVNEFFYQYLLQNDPQNAGLAGFRDSRIEHANRCAPDIGTGAVAFNEGDDRIVRHDELSVSARDRRAARWFWSCRISHMRLGQVPRIERTIHTEIVENSVEKPLRLPHCYAAIGMF